MLKLFFFTFFIAELIIAGALIIKLCQIDRCVNALNLAVLIHQPKIRFGLIDFREAIIEFRENVEVWLGILNQKRKEYAFRALKTSLIYVSILLLKGKYKKTVMAYQILSEIYSGILEAEADA